MGLGAQQSVLDQTIVASVATLVALVILRLGAKGAGMPTLGWVSDFCALAVVVVFALAAEAVAQLYIVPLCKTAQVAQAVRIAAPVVGVVALGTPLAAWILRGGYGKTLVSLIFAMIAAAVVIAATRAIIGSVHGEFREMNFIRAHKESMEIQLNRP